MEVNVQMAFGEERVSVKHRWCCGTLLRGRLTLLMRLSVCVNHGSTLEPRTTLTEEARGAKAAADAGNNCGGMAKYLYVYVYIYVMYIYKRLETGWWEGSEHKEQKPEAMGTSACSGDDLTRV